MKYADQGANIKAVKLFIDYDGAAEDLIRNKIYGDHGDLHPRLSWPN